MIELNQKTFIKFKNFLQNYGCEILPNTNPYEWIRWKGKEVGVIYTSGKTKGEYTNHAIKCYRFNIKWNGGPDSTKRPNTTKTQKLRNALLLRDGDKCFFCGKPLGEDITLEHLIALNQGGHNKLSNLVLAHEECNMEADHMPLVDKVNLAISKRCK